MFIYKRVVLIRKFIIINKFDWGLGIGDWGLGPIPNPQSPIPNFNFNALIKYYFFNSPIHIIN